jgi:trehalose/maltose hydrolase-like predicted phosphorylase
MKQQPDKLFHDKLASFSKEVPTAAWDKVERGLENRKRGFFWISVAASVTALILCAGMYYGFKDNPETIASNHGQDMAGAKDSIRSPKFSPQVQPPGPGTTENLEAHNKEEEKNVAQPTTVERKETPHTKSDGRHLAEAEVNSKLESEVLADTALSNYRQPTKLAFQAPTSTENITIILTAEQTQEYLLTKNVTAKATPEDKKSSTLKKLLKKAADLKVNQDPFGELRQRKNEILALNFRSEKQRGQKK